MLAHRGALAASSSGFPCNHGAVVLVGRECKKNPHDLFADPLVFSRSYCRILIDVRYCEVLSVS